LLVLYKTEWFVKNVVPTTLQLEQYKNTNESLFELPAWMKNK